MYQIGDHVVKAGAGVCEVTDIVHLDLPNVDKDSQFYLMIPKNGKGSKIFVQVGKEPDEMRLVMEEEQARTILKQIPEIEAANIENEKERELRYKELIRSCQPDCLIGLIKTIYERKKERSAQGKKSTALDERYLRQALEALYSELTFVLGEEREQMQECLKQALND